MSAKMSEMSNPTVKTKSASNDALFFNVYGGLGEI